MGRPVVGEILRGEASRAEDTPLRGIHAFTRAFEMPSQRATVCNGARRVGNTELREKTHPEPGIWGNRSKTTLGQTGEAQHLRVRYVLMRRTECPCAMLTVV